jgi:hypothetical protein
MARGHSRAMVNQLVHHGPIAAVPQPETARIIGLPLGAATQRSALLQRLQTGGVMGLNGGASVRVRLQG